MLVLLDANHDCVQAAYPSWGSRLRARLAANRLDRALANGASPDSTIALALRAQALVGTKERDALAASLERIVTATPGRPTRMPGFLDAAFYRRVHAASLELSELIDVLRGPGPLPAEGMAKARVLITDGLGPLHRGGDDLARAVRDAISALQATPTWA